MPIGSMILFVIYAVVGIYLLVNISSAATVMYLIGLPLLLLLIIPSSFVTLLTTKQFDLANGTLPFHNLHILLFIWAMLLGIICYTEFITWYLSEGTHETE